MDHEISSLTNSISSSMRQLTTHIRRAGYPASANIVKTLNSVESCIKDLKEQIWNKINSEFTTIRSFRNYYQSIHMISGYDVIFKDKVVGFCYKGCRWNVRPLTPSGFITIDPQLYVSYQKSKKTAISRYIKRIIDFPEMKVNNRVNQIDIETD